jgi:hypothetical protein
LGEAASLLRDRKFVLLDVRAIAGALSAYCVWFFDSSVHLNRWREDQVTLGSSVPPVESLKNKTYRMINVRIQKKPYSSAISFAFKDSSG